MGINLKILHTWEPEKARKRGDGKPPSSLIKELDLGGYQVKMYIQNRWKIKGEIEVENIYSGRYGKRTSPSERKVPTSEEQERINEQQCVRKLRRKIHANFDKDDLFETLTYRRDCRSDPKGAAHELQLLLNRLRGIWKRAGTELRYIVVTEYKSKSIHHHLIVNDLSDGTGAKRIAQSWSRNGHANTKYLYEDGQYERLAEYLIKETSKTFRDPDNPSKLRYSCSRNLVTPVAKTRVLKRDDWPEEPKTPKGYYLEKDSLVNGVNKMGYRFQFYRLIKIGGQKPQHEGKTGKKPTSRKNKKQRRRVVRKGRESHVPD